MTNTTLWGLGVVALADGDRWATLTIQPPDDAQHAELAVRLKSAGLKPMSPREWDGGLWPLSRCSVTVEADHVTQLHTGRSRILCAQPLATSEGWRRAAGRGRVVLALAQPGTLPTDAPTGTDLLQDNADAVATALRERRLLAGLAEVRTTAEPYGRRW
jgi:hypothetical protein